MAEYVQMFNGNQPFKNGSYIYGKINKEIVPIYYTSEDTDTVQIEIDNNKRTIKANVRGSVVSPIDDSTISEDTTWSSQKINEEINSVVSYLQVLPQASIDYDRKFVFQTSDNGLYICLNIFNYYRWVLITKYRSVLDQFILNHDEIY